MTICANGITRDCVTLIGELRLFPYALRKAWNLKILLGRERERLCDVCIFYVNLPSHICRPIQQCNIYTFIHHHVSCSHQNTTFAIGKNTYLKPWMKCVILFTIGKQSDIVFTIQVGRCFHLLGLFLLIFSFSFLRCLDCCSCCYYRIRCYCCIRFYDFCC